MNHELPLPLAEQIHEGIPGSRLRVFEHSSHMAMLEEPQQYLSEISEFLSGEPSPPHDGATREALYKVADDHRTPPLPTIRVPDIGRPAREGRGVRRDESRSSTTSSTRSERAKPRRWNASMRSSS